jgi:hypothetical protein
MRIALLATAALFFGSDIASARPEEPPLVRSLRLFGTSVLAFAGLLSISQPAQSQFIRSSNRARSWSAPARRRPPRLDLSIKASLSPCRRTATPPSWAGLWTTQRPGRHGSTLAVTGSGTNIVASWSAPAQLDSSGKAGLSGCLPTATPPSWADLSTTAAQGRRGSSSSRLQKTAKTGGG